MKISKKIISVLLALVILASATGVTAYGKTVEDFEKEIEDLENQIRDYESKIDSIKDNSAKQSQYIDELNGQIEVYNSQAKVIQDQIDVLNAEIAELDKQIGEYETKIAALEAEIAKIDVQIAEQKVKIDETYALLEKRIKAAYMGGEVSELEVFLNAESFQDFLTRTELMRQISKRDKQTVSELENQINSLNKMAQDLDNKRADLDESRAALDKDRQKVESSRQTLTSSKRSLEQKRAQIQSKVDQVKNYMGTLDRQSDEYRRLIAKADAQQDAFRREIDKIVNDKGSSGSGEIDSKPGDHDFMISTKGLICPLQGDAVNIREYSWNHEKRGNHNRAIDMGSKYGSTLNRKIYAVADGRVIMASYDAYSGNYMLIDHGNGVVTYYGHFNSMAVSAGTTVKQGQVIGYAGATGVVSGPHLHFELRVNGKQQYPENYLKQANGAYVKPFAV